MICEIGDIVKIVKTPNDERFEKFEVVKVLYWFASTNRYLVEKIDGTAQMRLQANYVVKYY